MTGADSLKDRVLAEVASGFPVSESPYCDLGQQLGVPEIDVLSAVLELRECGRLACVRAVFADADGFFASAAQDDADLAELVSADLPTGEHPYAEIAAQLQLRGTDQTADWVVSRLREWIADGTVVGVIGEVA